MSFADGQSQIRARLAAQWGITTPVDWPNSGFVPVIGVPWIRLKVKEGRTRQVDIGDRKKTFRTPGFIYVQVFTATNIGNGPALALGDQVAAIFRNWCGSSVKCYAASVQDIGPDEKGWYQVNVEVPFVRDELI